MSQEPQAFAGLIQPIVTRLTRTEKERKKERQNKGERGAARTGPNPQEGENEAARTRGGRSKNAIGKTPNQATLNKG